MTATDPSPGDVDPTDPAAVAAVLATVHRLTGPEGIVDLLTRLPGVDFRAGRPGGLLRAAAPATLSLSREYVVELRDVPVLVHTVGGIALSHVPLTGEALPELVRLVTSLVRVQYAEEEARIVLTGARNGLAGL